MYELIQVAERTFYIDCPAKMGLYLDEGERVYLIDSGNDKEAGKKVEKHLKAQGWDLFAILNTHSNADHIGGNQVLQERTGCRIFAAGAEAAFTRKPMLEPSFLYGGYPCKALRNKFLMAKESRAEDLEKAPLPSGMEVIPLPGHFLDMVGFRTPDGVWFLADCLTGAAILDKYHISFIYDVVAYLKTLDMVERLEGEVYILAHGEVQKDIRPLVRLNRDKVLEIRDKLLLLCGMPVGFEDLLAEMFRIYDLRMDFNQYVLVGSTLRSSLSWLADQGLIQAEFLSNKLLWRRMESGM